MAAPFAFVTLVSSDAYLPGALAQVAALAELHPRPLSHASNARDYTTVCLVTPESVDVATVKNLRNAFDLVVGVEILEQQNNAALTLLGRPDLTTVLTKLHVFRLTQFSKIIFLDADVLPIRPIDHLFDLPHEFSAVPDVGWPDIFNSGVLVLSPGEDKFSELNHLVQTQPSWDGGDQGLLNEWRGSNWHRLSFTYNTTPTAAYTYAPAYERYGSQISAIHFIGPNKPWNSIPHRPPFAAHQGSRNDASRRAYNYDALVDRWYDVYDRHYRASTPPQSRFEVNQYDAVWDAKQPVRAAPHTFSLEKLKELAINGINASFTTPDSPGHRPTQGEYKSMPLEGRIDLMRPRKPVPSREDSSPDSQPTPLPTYIHIPPPWRDLPSDSFSYEDAPTTPRNFPYDSDGPRWYTLPTPGPHEVPDSPRFPAIPLPSIPSVFLNIPKPSPDFYASESETESLLLSQHHGPSYPPHQPHHHEHDYRRPAGHKRQGSPLYHQHHGHHDQHRERLSSGARPQTPQHVHQRPPSEARRPKSPPLLVWNPAVEPPPNTAPIPNAFPANTYFANAWDQPPPRHADSTRKTSRPPVSATFFQPLPTPGIPGPLIKQGHYRNITGEGTTGEAPSPDRTKIKHIFPWEEKPRNPPGRVFPDSDAPPPSLFLSPGSQSYASTTTAPSTPETKGALLHKGKPLSPLYGLSTSLSFANAWDTVPSIQKYATMLARPANLAPPFDDSAFKKGKRARGDRSEVSSRDGDDEGNADDEDEGESVTKSGTEDDDSDLETMRRRSRSSSIVSVSYPPQREKEYRDRGVQTLMPEKRSFGVQAERLSKPEKPLKRPHLQPSNSSGPGKRQWPPANGVHLVAPTPTKELQKQYKPKLSSPSVRSPRDFLAAAPKPTRPNSAPPRPVSRTYSAPTPTPPPHPRPVHKAPPLKVARQVSYDSPLGSPSSPTVGPWSPSEAPVKRGGRVWDPARGIELFKRGSEEVLARFLRMGSFDEEPSSQ